MADHTPSYVMYSDLKRFGRISNYDAARLLLSDARKENEGQSLRDRTEDRTFLSRRVVNAAPGDLPADAFEDAEYAARGLISLMLARRKPQPNARAEIERHYAGEATEVMCRTLRSYGVDANVYRSLVSRVSLRDDLTESQRVVLLVMLYVIMGCRCDPAEAVARVDDFVLRNQLDGTGTAETLPGSDCWQSPSRGQTADDEALGLMRLFPDGSMRSQVYRISEEPGGTVIGSLACEPRSITDVEGDVSRRHLKIELDDGSWYAEGLGSTNGTVVFEPGSDDPCPIELPRSQRERGGGGAARRRIRHGDILQLGSSTRFLVVRVAPEIA